MEAFACEVYLYPDKVVIVSNITDAQSDYMEVEAALEKLEPANDDGFEKFPVVGGIGGLTRTPWCNTESYS